MPASTTRSAMTGFRNRVSFGLLINLGRRLRSTAGSRAECGHPGPKRECNLPFHTHDWPTVRWPSSSEIRERCPKCGRRNWIAKRYVDFLTAIWAVPTIGRILNRPRSVPLFGKRGASRSRRAGSRYRRIGRRTPAAWGSGTTIQDRHRGRRDDSLLGCAMARFPVATLRGELRFSSQTFEIRQAGKPGRLSCPVSDSVLRIRCASVVRPMAQPLGLRLSPRAR